MMAETFDCVTIFYGDIMGFNKLISDSSADEVGAIWRQDREANASFTKPPLFGIGEVW